MSVDHESRRLLARRIEQVQVLERPARPLGLHGVAQLLSGGAEAVRRGVIGFDAVKQLVIGRIERRPPQLSPEAYPYLPAIVDELGYVPLSQVGAELLFEVFSQRYERGSIIVISNLPFEEWPSVFRNERLTGALLDRLIHHVHLLEMNGESYRLRQSVGRRKRNQTS